MTHKQRVLDLLSDGQPHGHLELYRLGCVAHSRVSDLRKDGHTIRAWRDSDTYVYQLESPLDATEAPRTGSPSPVHPVPPVSVASSGVSLTDGRDVATPLTLFDTERSVAA